MPLKLNKKPRDADPGANLKKRSVAMKNNICDLREKIDILEEEVKLIELRLSHAKSELHYFRERLFDWEDLEWEAMTKIGNRG